MKNFESSLVKKDINLFHQLSKILPANNSIICGLYWIRTSDPYSVKVML